LANRPGDLFEARCDGRKIRKNTEHMVKRMKQEFNRHGRRLSAAEYEKGIVSLYAGQAPMPTKTEEIEIRRAELNLMIDHRLGLDFPADRREKMWEVAQKVEKGRVVTAFKIVASYLMKGMANRKHKDGSAADADFLARETVKKYRAVLDAEELEQFLGPTNDRTLPPNFWRG
jgi:hypothetical protein